MNMHGKRVDTNFSYSVLSVFLCVLYDTVVSSSLLIAATPRDELLRLVPDTIGFCVVLQDLRGHAAALQDSPFVEQFNGSSLAVKIHNSEELKKLARIESKMKAKLGLDWTRLRDDILGDAVVFAYRPGPPGKPEQEQGVMLLRARNEKVLADLIERVNKVQKEEGELKDLEERRHNGAVYYRRLEVDKRSERDKPPMFYYVHGAVLALSAQESMLRHVIDSDQAPPHPQPLSPAGKGEKVLLPSPRWGEGLGVRGEAARRLRELDAERALLALWINPRAFDAELNAKIAGTPAEHSATVKHFSRYWKALDSVVLSVALAARDISLSLGVRARIEELPPACQRLFGEGATASDLWRRFPESALLAAGGRIDGVALLDALGSFLTPEHRQSLHAVLNRQFAALLGEDDFARDVLPGLGPDWGLCITAASPQEKSWMPQMLLALRVDAARTKKALDRKLLGALDFAARLVIFAHNNEHPDRPIALKTGDVEGQEVRYLASERGLPAGVQPAYGFLHGYLLLSSSLDGLARFARTTPAPAAAPVSSIPLLRISVKDWKTYLHERREPIIQFLADRNNVSREDAAQRIKNLLAGLQFLERIELRQRSAPAQVIFTLSVQTTQALKK
jgi:hypothetical protein